MAVKLIMGLTSKGRVLSRELAEQNTNWSSLKNGELLLQAADRFDVFVTADQNLQFQQNLSKLPIAVLVLVAVSNRMESLRPLIPGLRSALNALRPRMLVRVGGQK